MFGQLLVSAISHLRSSQKACVLKNIKLKPYTNADETFFFFFFFFLKFLADTCPFLGPTGTPVLDFW